MPNQADYEVSGLPEEEPCGLRYKLAVCPALYLGLPCCDNWKKARAEEFMCIYSGTTSYSST